MKLGDLVDDDDRARATTKRRIATILRILLLWMEGPICRHFSSTGSSSSILLTGWLGQITAYIPKLREAFHIKYMA